MFSLCVPLSGHGGPCPYNFIETSMNSSPPSRSPRSNSPSTGSSAPSAPRRKSSSKKGLPSPPLSANERGVQRRAKRKKQQKRKNWLVWLGFFALTAMIAGVALGVSSRTHSWPHFKGVWGEYKEVQAKVQTKQATLRDLRAQLDRAKKRLAGFDRGSGRERALAENGFVRPGERILLFPPGKDDTP